MTREAKVKHGSFAIKLAALALTCVAAEAAGAQQDPKDIIAAQIRSQGYACDHPKVATRDAQASKPYSVVWLLTCENSAYRVTLVPNLAAKVEIVSQTGRDSSQ